MYDRDTMYNSHRIGTGSELVAAAYYVSLGWIVSRPVDSHNEYDLVVDNGKTLFKIQVKTVYWSKPKKRYLVSCQTSSFRSKGLAIKKYTQKSFDYLVAVEPKTNSLYQIPINKIIGRRGITLYPEGIPNSRTGRYEDFEKYRITKPRT